MRGQLRRDFLVRLEHQGQYRFCSLASEDGRPHGAPFASDEPGPIGEASAPSTPALLAAALGHCLSASLLEALRHARLHVDGCTTDAVTVVIPDGDGLPRIDHVAVTIRPQVREASGRLSRCREVFERHCTVTSSVRRGIDVRVDVEWDVRSDEGTAAHTAPDAEVVP